MKTPTPTRPRWWKPPRASAASAAATEHNAATEISAVFKLFMMTFVG
jgi:hypothetical protein